MSAPNIRSGLTTYYSTWEPHSPSCSLPVLVREINRLVAPVHRFTTNVSLVLPSLDRAFASDIDARLMEFIFTEMDALPRGLRPAGLSPFEP